MSSTDFRHSIHVKTIIDWTEKARARAKVSAELEKVLSALSREKLL
jgi:hypothetical protein